MASKPRKLLVAALGIGTVTFACCAVFPGCNLVLSQCDTEPAGAECRDFAMPKEQDLSLPRDLSEKDQ